MPQLEPLSPPSGPPEPRRTARRLFAQAMLEADHKKARTLFQQAAEALPPGGPALYQAALRASLDGDAPEAHRLFDQALTALEQSTRLGARLTGPQTEMVPDETAHSRWRLSAKADGRLALIQTDQLTSVVETLGFRALFEHKAPTTAAALSDDGTRVVLATRKRLFSCSLVEAACSRVTLAVPLVDLALPSDSTIVATLRADGVVEVRDAETLAVRTTITKTRGHATAVAISPAGDRVFAGLIGGPVLVLRADTGEVESTLRGNAGAGVIVALAVDGSDGRLAAADVHGVRVWAPGDEKGELVRQATEKDEQVESLAWSPAGKSLFIGTSSRLKTWTVADKTMQSRDLAQPDAISVYSLHHRFAPAGGRLYHLEARRGLWKMAVSLTAHEMTEPSMLDLGHQLPGTWDWHVDKYYRPSFPAAGPVLGVAWVRGDIDLWDIAQGAFVRTVKTGDWCEGADVRLSADGKKLLMVPDANPDRGSCGPQVGRTIDIATGAKQETPLGRGSTLRERSIDAFFRQPFKTPLPAGVPPDASSVIEALGTVLWVQSSTVFVGPRGGPFHTLGELRAGDPQYNPSFALSPKGALAGIQVGDRAEIWPVGADKPLRVVEHAGITGIQFGADETGFISALDGTLTMVRGGTTRTLSLPDGAPIIQLVPLRGGRLMAAVAGGFGPAVFHIFSADDGVLRATLAARPGRGVAISPGGLGEVFGPIDGELSCRFGPFVFDLALCRDHLIKPGLFSRMLDGERVDP
jgi:WD40 repeat protein